MKFIPVNRMCFEAFEALNKTIKRNGFLYAQQKRLL